MRKNGNKKVIWELMGCYRDLELTVSAHCCSSDEVVMSVVLAGYQPSKTLSHGLTFIK